MHVHTQYYNKITSDQVGYLIEPSEEERNNATSVVIEIPEGVNINIVNNTILIKGKRGELKNSYPESVRVIKEDNKQQFGGFWTEKKLQIVRKYMETYTKALKKQAWINELVYIDGFAGSGERLDKFTGELCEGSASISLNSGFDKWHFIEKNPVNNLKLNQLKIYVENSG